MTTYYDANDLQNAREQIALEHWEAMDDTAQEWLTDVGSEYIVNIARGGDIAVARLADLRRDCLASLAEWVSDKEAKQRVRDLCLHTSDERDPETSDEGC